MRGSDPTDFAHKILAAAFVLVLPTRDQLALEPVRSCQSEISVSVLVLVFAIGCLE